jgi:hypothetical protein
MIDDQHCQHAENRNRYRDHEWVAQHSLPMISCHLKVPDSTFSSHQINPVAREGSCQEGSCQEAATPSQHFQSEAILGPAIIQTIRSGQVPCSDGDALPPAAIDHTLKSLA